jgi:hypothetical protein
MIAWKSLITQFLRNVYTSKTNLYETPPQQQILSSEKSETWAVTEPLENRGNNKIIEKIYK